MAAATGSCRHGWVVLRPCCRGSGPALDDGQAPAAGGPTTEGRQGLAEARLGRQVPPEVMTAVEVRVAALVD